MSHYKVVTLCGSTRFGDAFAAANLRETLAGKIVLTVGCTTHSDSELGISQDSKVKRDLDALHMAKIAMSDEVLVLNVDGYIGESTAKETDFAVQLGKRVRFLDEGAGSAWWRDRYCVERPQP